MNCLKLVFRSESSSTSTLSVCEQQRLWQDHQEMKTNDANLSSVQYCIVFCLFDLILYVLSTIFQLKRDRFSWVEPVLCLAHGHSAL